MTTGEVTGIFASRVIGIMVNLTFLKINSDDLDRSWQGKAQVSGLEFGLRMSLLEILLVSFLNFTFEQAASKKAAQSAH